MAMERVPYLVGGGFEHSAEVMRAMLAAATSGAEGLVNAGDMKVQPLQTPGTSIRVAPGNALIRNSYTGGTAQTYAARAASETLLPIQATSSGGPRTDLVVARIDDPTYAGTTFDPQTFQAAKLEVIRGVPATQADVRGLNLAYPAIALARITLPASTGTVTSAHIKDLRELAQPRKDRRLFVTALTEGDGSFPIPLDGQARWWPLLATNTVDIPIWAQRVRIVGQWGGVKIPGGNTNAYGRAWVRIGEWADQSKGISSQEVSWDLEMNRASNSRVTWLTGADRAVPETIRGLRGQQIGLMSKKNGGNAPLDQMPLLDSLSMLYIDVEFYETAV